MIRERVLETSAGTFGAIDFGGEGRDILMLHQLTSNAQVWVPLGEELAKVGRAVAIDLPGHGRSALQHGGFDRITDDLPLIVEALGMTRPLVLLEQEELLILSPDRLAGLGGCGFFLIGLSSCRRGEEAKAEWREVVGPNSLEVWRERFGLFATGSMQELQGYVDRTVQRASTDWVNEGVAPNQYRAYLERNITTTEDGWRRRPRRDVLERALHHIAEGVHGLDLLDQVDAPLWIAASPVNLCAEEVATLNEYAANRANCRVIFVRGGQVVDSLDPQDVSSAVARMLEATEG
ncbi:alpha/beta hydrolase [Gephyromycinifex aptenodytis]|uniref:alpha/beta hydrolase n=1 Tax=Gephyromycinifex aptenodytis TaxID=2716227 RepID=UPI0014473C4E|nr:hypothetical protein [Gephyromycinifex aptenodytis]